MERPFTVQSVRSYGSTKLTTGFDKLNTNGNRRCRRRLVEGFCEKIEAVSMGGVTMTGTYSPDSGREEMLKQALAHCESGDFQEAETLARRLHEADPDDENALRLLAQAVYGQKRFEEAVLLMNGVLRLNPMRAAHHNDLGAMLAAMKRWPEAEAAYRMAKALDPRDANAAFNLALALFRQKRTEAALREIETLEKSHPDLADTYALRGEILLDEERFDEAFDMFSNALERGLNTPETDANLAFALFKAGKRKEAFERLYKSGKLDQGNARNNYCMGYLLREKGELDEARRFLEKAIEIDPKFAEAHHCLGLVLTDQSDFSGAEDAYSRALELAPENANAYLNLGNLYSKQRKGDAARACFEQAIAIAPDSGVAWNNLALLYNAEHRFDEAEEAFGKALSKDPDAPLFRFNYGVCRLAQGDFETGWKDYEKRFEMKQDGQRAKTNLPRWNGEPLDGKSLLIEYEQGLGDAIQFVRYLGILRARYPSARIAFQCYSPLVRLFSIVAAKYGVTLLTQFGLPDETSWDFSIPLLSIPMHIAGARMTIPSDTPYLNLPASFVSFWKQRLSGLAGKKAGLVWSGGEQYKAADRRNMTLKHFLPLFDIPGISWVSLQKLQKGKAGEEIAAEGLPEKIFDPMAEVKDFADTAAIIANLDLVISVDTSVAHLAGAMGVPVWLMNRFDTDWRWLYDRSDSLWYPTMRIFRQKRFGDWAPVVEEAAGALKEWLGADEARRMWTLLAPPRPDAAFSLALALFRGGKADEALRVLDALEEKNPEFAWQFLLRGKILRAEGRDEEAVDVLSKAVTLGIETPDAVSHLGMALAGAGFRDEAHKVLAGSGKADSGDPNVNYCLGTLLREKGDIDGARHCFEQAVGANPRFSQAFEALALVSRELGDTAGAEAALERVTEISGEFERVRAAFDEFARGVFGAGQ
ncbi:MAG: tetratricopeptide repeat protein [Candidatus Accumulibacter sp.]|nr:tetratricopeptide repeat protein [Accumulibacter sp.]